MVFDKVRLDESQVKRNSPRRHEGIHMYQHQMEDCSLPVKLELKKTHTHSVAFNNLPTKVISWRTNLFQTSLNLYGGASEAA